MPAVLRLRKPVLKSPSNAYCTHQATVISPPGKKLGRRMGPKITQCFSENAGLWPKNTGKPIKNSKQDRDLVSLNFKKITPVARQQGC